MRTAPGLVVALPGFALSVLLGFACRRPSVAVPADTLAEATIAHSPQLPEECKEYALAMKRCMESPSFPAEVREGERLALAQMLASFKLDEVRDAERAAEWREVAQNCRDSISTMKESGKVSCPGVF